LAGPLPGLRASIVTEGPGKANGSTTVGDHHSLPVADQALQDPHPRVGRISSDLVYHNEPEALAAAGMAYEPRDADAAAAGAAPAALKAQLSTLGKQLKDMHEEDWKKSEALAMDKIQIEQLKARIAFLDREYEGSKEVSELIC